MDKIILRNVKVKTIIGTLPEERTEKQQLKVNVELSLHLKAAGESDDLRDSVDYSEIERRIVELGHSSSFNLVERFAEEVAKICLGYKRITRAVVSVDKPDALKNSKSVAVVIERSGT
ncbi:dihydroneopterin aldolase [Lentisphaerota bacterium ZTH]|nr:dihydroneopterin aldolase [Lentisphaerota bacterium]WET07129.1 dihydroneopterin aldolase [Lentisphaerota bacterium ZTH]